MIRRVVRILRGTGLSMFPPLRWLYQRTFLDYLRSRTSFSHLQRTSRGSFSIPLSYKLSTVDRILMESGSYEVSTCEVLESLLRENDVFVDVGAHLGFFSLYASTLVGGGKVVSFEPTPSSFSRLASNIESNGFSNILAMNLALSNKKKKLKMSHQEFNTGQSSISSKGNIVVSSERLDSLVKLPIRLLKIDVEGHELEVLEGASKLLKKTDFVFVEVKKGLTDSKIKSFMLKNNFVVYQVLGEGRVFDIVFRRKK